MSFDFDIALSFAGEDRAFVEAVAEQLRTQNIRVFYDGYQQVALWGKDLTETLDDIYQHRSRFVVLFISKYYADKMWTRHERRSAFARALREKREYVLPARFDNTPLPGLPPTLAYISLDGETPATFAAKLAMKVSAVSSRAVVESHLPMGEVRTLFGHTSSVTSVLFTPDGTHALSTSLDTSMRLWDVRTGGEIHRFTGHTGAIHCLAISADGRYALTGSGSDVSLRGTGLLAKAMIEVFADKTRPEDYSIRLWDLQQRVQIHRFPTDTSDTYVRHVAFHPAGTHFVSTNRFVCDVWNVRTGQRELTLTSPPPDEDRPIEDVCFSRDGEILLRTLAHVHTLPLQGGTPIRQLKLTASFNWYSFAPDGIHLLATGADDIHLYNLLTGRCVQSARRLHFSAYSVVDPVTGRVFGQTGRGYCAIDLASKRVLFDHEDENYDFSDHALALSADGMYALSGSETGAIRVWRLPPAG